MLNKEANDRSEVEGDDYQNEDMLRDKRAENMDIGGPGGTGSSGNNFDNQAKPSTNKQTPQIRSYMEAQSNDVNVSASSRLRK